MPPVTLIVLNWNGRQLLSTCLPSLLALEYGDYHVVVVDNASTDGSVAFVRDNFPAVTLIENEQNLGFAGGNNVSLRRLETDVAVLVNPDVVVDRSWLQALVAGLTADDNTGIAGCKLLQPDGRRLQHAGGTVTAPRALPGYVGLNEPDEGQYDTLRYVDYVAGAAMALKRDVLQTIGLLDEGFFLYYEDADLCARARRAGYRVVYVPQARAVHDESSLTERGSEAYLAWFHAGRWRFILKHYGVEAILAETFPAERKWLARQDANHVMARVYGQLLRRYDNILADRARDGNTTTGDAQTAALRRALADLRQASWHSHGRQAMEALWDLQELPFRSKVPLLGPLIAAVRAGWNRIAARDFVRPLARQQSEFNRLTGDWLQQQEQRLTAHDERATRLATDLSALRAQIARLQQRASQLDEHLARLDEHVSGSESGTGTREE